jgi:hypothetical protein
MNVLLPDRSIEIFITIVALATSTNRIDIDKYEEED